VYRISGNNVRKRPAEDDVPMGTRDQHLARNRVTEAWKMRISGNPQASSRSSIEIDE
jgi:hypothetical protein